MAKTQGATTTCPTCEGTGVDPARRYTEAERECSACGGLGEVAVDSAPAPTPVVDPAEETAAE